MSVKLTKVTRLNSRLVTWQVSNTTEGTSIQLSEADLKDLLQQGAEAIEEES